jgi:hypothetical protein
MLLVLKTIINSEIYAALMNYTLKVKHLRVHDRQFPFESVYNPGKRLQVFTLFFTVKYMFYLQV